MLCTVSGIVLCLPFIHKPYNHQANLTGMFSLHGFTECTHRKKNDK